MAFCPLSDIAIFPGPAAHLWVLCNVFARSFLGTTTKGLDLWQSLGSGSSQGQSGSDELADAQAPTKPELQTRISVFPISFFPWQHGLLEDPAGFLRDHWPDPEHLGHDQFLTRLTTLGFLAPSEQSYLDRFARKGSLLDFEHFGTLHEQIGQHLIVRQRISPDEWWVKQKFEDDLTALRPNLYGSVQGPYLRKYFARALKNGVRALDVGCGVGFYSRWMADAGAIVTACDPNPIYIGRAKELCSHQVSFQTLALPDGLERFPDASFDFIFMSDALLFYFHPIEPQNPPDLKKLLAHIRRLLAPKGIVTFMEPHPVFYQQPWFGSSRRPWTVVTEYHNKRFGIVPTLSELFSNLFSAGFHIRGYEEVGASPDDSRATARALAFAKEFPIWHVIEAAAGSD